MKELFVINTTLEKKDFREYLYITTFLKNRRVFLVLYGVCLALSAISNLILRSFTVENILIRSVIVFTGLVVLMCIGIEIKSRRFAKNYRAGEMGQKETLRFYEEYMEVGMKSGDRIEYERFYELLESKNYFLFYLNEKYASFVRKSDVPECEKFIGFLQSVFGDKYKKI